MQVFHNLAENDIEIIIKSKPDCRKLNDLTKRPLKN